VILFAEDLQEFLQGFDEALRVLEKAEREKRRGKGEAKRPFDGDSAPDPRAGRRDTEERRHNFDTRPGPRRSFDQKIPRRNTDGRGRKSNDHSFGAGKRESPYSGSRRPRKDQAFSRSGSFDNDSFENRSEHRKGAWQGKRKIIVKKR
jgi:hypothetical protein